MIKNILTSKAVWFNIVVFVIAILALPEFVKVLPASWISYDLLGGAVGNEILRIWFTSQPLTTFAANNQ